MVLSSRLAARDEIFQYVNVQMWFKTQYWCIKTVTLYISMIVKRRPPRLLKRGLTNHYSESFCHQGCDGWSLGADSSSVCFGSHLPTQNANDGRPCMWKSYKWEASLPSCSFPSHVSECFHFSLLSPHPCRSVRNKRR